MTSDSTEKVPPVNEGASPDEPEEKTIGGKASADEIYLIDRAALELRKKRGPFVVEAAVEKARQVLAAKSVLESSPAA
jgi:uncharacterized protein (DUF1778 family)